MRIHLHDLLVQQAALRPTAAALTTDQGSRDYRTVLDAVTDGAHGLLALGLQREDRVAIWLDKRHETVDAIFAVSAAGGVFVPVNPALRPAQVGHVLADCTARFLVTTHGRWRSLQQAGGRAPDVVVLVDDPAPVGAGTTTRVCGWDALLDAGRSADAAALPRGTDGDLAGILYTSGSTGRPKGVVLSHRNLIVGAESVSDYLGNDDSDVILAALPLSFDAGLSQVTTAFAAGAHVVLVNYLLPRDVVRACARHGVTGLTCVPPLWIRLAEVDWPAEATARLRYFANTGGRMSRATLHRLRVLFPAARPFLMYGLTEAFRSTYLDPEQVQQRPDSIGRAIPDAEILVLRPDGTPAAPGEEGELVHRGPTVALGYWNDPERTAERFRPLPGSSSSWRQPERAVWSGDTVVADEEGYLYFVGRTDDMIKTSGYRVSPTEVEEAAYETGLVGDAAAIGVEDDRLGQRIVLCVSPPAHDRVGGVDGSDVDAADGTDGSGEDARTRVDPAGLIRRMRRQLPLFMVPAEVRVLDALPRSPNGKFDRVLLRKEVS